MVIEQADKVCGLACTESYRGVRFDMGGHRLFMKSKGVPAMEEDVGRPVARTSAPLRTSITTGVFSIIRSGL